MTRILHPPEPWAARCRAVTLWHGCCRRDAESIAAAGVDPAFGRPDTDFGRGFYTTTFRRQAEKWAWQRYARLPPTATRGNGPVVVAFRVPLDRLARLESLHFVSEVGDEQPFWGFIHHCRQGGVGHLHPGRTPPDDWYDVVGGPVAAFWEQCVVMKDADQFSFHTPAAAAVLNDLVRSGGDDYRVLRVRKRR